MTPTTLSTDRVPPAERAGYWSDIISRSFGRLRSDTYGDAGFSGHVSQVALGSVRVSRLEATRHRVMRTAGSTGPSDPGYLKMVVQHRGQSLFEQNGRRALLGPGCWSLYDTTSSYSVDTPSPVTLDVLLLPREALLEGRRELDELLVRRLSCDSGMSRVACAQIRAVVESAIAGSADPAEPPPGELGETILRLVRTALFEQAGMTKPLSQRWITRERIKEFIERRLGDPDLDADTIARALNCSKRTLHYAFEHEDISLHRHIWNLRLDAARRDLESGRHREQSITEIAFARGFSSPAHFSRAFRARYGASPRQWLAGERAA
jgi:AraC-like DNA-binding protein